MIGRCLHILDNANIRGHVLPFRAHIRMKDQPSAIEEVVDGVHIEFDHDRCTPRAVEFMANLTAGDEQELYNLVSHQALGIFNMKRLKGEPIDGDPRLD